MPKKNINDASGSSITLMDLYQQAGYTQKGFAEILTRRFQEIGSNRKVTPKSIREWNSGKFQPRFTPSETLEVCLLLNCNLYDLALATKPRSSSLDKNTDVP